MNSRGLTVLSTAGLVALVGGIYLGRPFHQSARPATAPSYSAKRNALVTPPKTDVQHAAPLPTPCHHQGQDITREEATHVVPLPPAHVAVDMIGNAVRVTWLGTGEDGIHYEVDRKIVNTVDWQQVAVVNPIGDNRGRYEFRDTTATAGLTYIYGVRVVNAYGTKSTLSESSAITVVRT